MNVRIDWRQVIIKVLFGNFIIPYLADPGDITELIRKAKSPRRNNKPRRSSISNDSAPSPRRLSTNGSSLFRKFGSSSKASYIENKIEDHFIAIARIYDDLARDHNFQSDNPSTSDRDPLKHLKFMMNNFIEDFLKPIHPRPVIESDLFYDISELYENLLVILTNEKMTEIRDELVKEYGLKLQRKRITEIEKYLQDRLRS